jgi:carboxymethylenebutenolidase
MDQRIIQLYDSFTHGHLNRRDFLDRLTKLAGSGAAAVALLPMLKNDYAQAAVVQENDPRLVVERVTYDSPKGKISGYLVRPAAKGKRPAVVVIHENRGLNPHIEDIARRLALEGFLALAPDLLSISGGTPPEEDKARELHSKTNPQDITIAATAAVPFLRTHAESDGNVGAIGFCFGGSVVNQMASASPELKAGVAYYGSQIPAAQVPAIKASLLLHYGGLDERINAGIPAYEAALKENGKRYTVYMYPGVNHAFNNETGGARYNKEAADLSWTRTLAFFKEQLGPPPRAS